MTGAQNLDFCCCVKLGFLLLLVGVRCGVLCCRFVYHLGLLSYVADSAVRAAAGCLEWMGDELQKDFNSSSINPLACRCRG